MEPLTSREQRMVTSSCHTSKAQRRPVWWLVIWCLVGILGVALIGGPAVWTLATGNGDLTEARKTLGFVLLLCAFFFLQGAYIRYTSAAGPALRKLHDQLHCPVCGRPRAVAACPVCQPDGPTGDKAPSQE